MGGGNTAIKNAYDQVIAQNLDIIGVQIEDTDLPQTKVLHTMAEGRAKRVIAQPLTKIPGNTSGSSPKENPDGWDKIAPQERASNWVRAHLLNHQLHGPGVRWNLFPGSKQMNTAQMENQVESPAKRMLWRENKVLYYNVVVVYGNQGDMRPFPTEVHMEFGEFDYQNNRRMAPTVRTKFNQPPAQLHTVNLNQDTAGRLKETARANGVRGVGGLIDKIVLERANGRFTDIDDIEDRLASYYSKRSSLETAIERLDDLISRRIIEIS